MKVKWSIEVAKGEIEIDEKLLQGLPAHFEPFLIEREVSKEALRNISWTWEKVEDGEQ